MKDKSLEKRLERVGKSYEMMIDLINHTMQEVNRAFPDYDAATLAQKLLVTASAYMVENVEGTEEAFIEGCKAGWQIARQMESVETPVSGEKEKQ